MSGLTHMFHAREFLEMSCVSTVMDLFGVPTESRFRRRVDGVTFRFEMCTDTIMLYVGYANRPASECCEMTRGEFIKHVKENPAFKELLKVVGCDYQRLRSVVITADGVVRVEPSYFAVKEATVDLVEGHQPVPKLKDVLGNALPHEDEEH